MEDELLRIVPAGDLGKATATLEGTGYVEGYASTWRDQGGEDRQDEIVARGAFAKAVAAINAGTVNVPLISAVEHEWEDVGAVVGRVVKAREDDTGLWVRADFGPDDHSQQVRQKTLTGGLSFSVGGFVRQARQVNVAGKKVRELLELDLAHVLLTPTPANRSARVLAAKTAGPSGLSKAGMPVHHTAVTDSGRWDAGANVGRISNDARQATLRKMFALVRSGGDPDTKEAYGLPHHVVGEDGQPGPAHVAAVRNALARLPQAQGIDDATRAAAERHLRAHLDDFNERAAASLDLPDGWAEDMRSALAISDPIASKVAVDRLVTSHYGPVLAGGYRHMEPVADYHNDIPNRHEHDDQGAARYALELIGESGTAGGDSTPDSLADLLAPVEAAKSSEELDQLMAELKEEQ